MAKMAKIARLPDGIALLEWAVDSENFPVLSETDAEMIGSFRVPAGWRFDIFSDGSVSIESNGYELSNFRTIREFMEAIGV